MNELQRVTPLTLREQDIEARMNKALDDLARAIGRSAVNHLKTMYPEAMAAVVKNAEVSLTNHVRNEINFHMRPLLATIRSLAAGD